ncbi:MAG: hypothetical protein QM802_26860 [Agriterribacter sp.]
MLATLKSQVFIDTLVFELNDETTHYLKAILKDEGGKICSTLETNLEPSQKIFSWRGFNDLPYGVYMLELIDGTEYQQMRLVKRI